uniref:Glycosyltransferase n=1 Tax=Oryza glumipatula TaxID=40148 RepID=A0A0E0A182_9ORYZ
MASTDRSKKLRVLLIPFLATSHIGPFTDLAVRLVTARPDAVEPTIAVTPANVSVVRSALERHGSAATSVVSIATYPFPEVAGLPRGVENLSTAGADGWRIDVAATNEALTRPAQEALISGQSPDALITDAHFFWNAGLAEELGVPCVLFSVIGLFSGLAMRFVTAAAANDDSDSAELTLAGFPGAELRFPKSELPDFLIRQGNLDGIDPNKIPQGQRMCHGLAVNAFLGMEQPYRERFLRDGLAKRVYLEQLDELALGLEASGEPFLWAVRADGWSPPAGWEERVGERGVLVRGWVPQTAILSHPATAAFLTHCGSSSLLEAVAAGVPLLTWPLVFDQFIEERLVTDVLRIGERVWDGPRSVRHEEAMVVPAAAVARALARFLEPGGAGDAARLRAQELAAEAHAAVAEGGSSYRDLRRLVDDMVEARAAGGEAAAAPQPQ